MCSRGDGRGRALALGLALGFAADRIAGDPARWHPVAGFGRVASALENRLYADDKASGVVFNAVLVGGATGLGALLQRLAGGNRCALTTLTALATWTVLGGRSLTERVRQIADALEADDLEAARGGVAHLVSRDPHALDGAGVARAALESLAENTSDAVVAPLLWGAVLGIPGLLGYRAVNTLDAMVGYRNSRYTNFGWASARVDDAANWVPARVAAALAVMAAPVVGGSPSAAARAVRRDAPAHPSPNGGRIEAAFAGALGVRLGGSNVYDGVSEDRGVLGDGREVEPSDVARANRLARVVMVAAAAVAVAVAAFRAPPRPH